MASQLAGRTYEIRHSGPYRFCQQYFVFLYYRMHIFGAVHETTSQASLNEEVRSVAATHAR